MGRWLRVARTSSHRDRSLTVVQRIVDLQDAEHGSQYKRAGMPRQTTRRPSAYGTVPRSKLIDEL